MFFNQLRKLSSTKSRLVTISFKDIIFTHTLFTKPKWKQNNWRLASLVSTRRLQAFTRATLNDIA